MTHRFVILLLALLVVLLTAPSSSGSSAAEQDPATEIRSAEDLDSWIDSLGEPGDGHEVLEAMVGIWEGRGSIWDSPESVPVSITMSFGVTEFFEGDKAGPVFARADKALYQAKEKGRNCCILAKE